MQILSLTSEIESNPLDLIYARLNGLPEGDELFIQSDQDCEYLLEKLQETSLKNLRWNTKKTSDGQWFAQVRIARPGHCCGGCS